VGAHHRADAHKDGKGECDKALPTWGELEVVSHGARR
jgi:hypothetical protein